MVIAAVITALVRKLRDEYIEAEIINFKEEDWHINENLPKSVPNESNENRPKPPSAEFVSEARRRRLHEAKMIDVILEIVVYVCYLSLCLMIAYGHRDPDAYQTTHHVEKMFFVHKFEQVRLPSLYPAYCKFSIFGSKYLSDIRSHRLTPSLTF